MRPLHDHQGEGLGLDNHGAASPPAHRAVINWAIVRTLVFRCSHLLPVGNHRSRFLGQLDFHSLFVLQKRLLGDPAVVPHVADIRPAGERDLSHGAVAHTDIK